MPKSDYKRYLASAHWRKVRARYRASSLPQVCAVCGEQRVQLHHLTYARVGCERLSDLQPLCAIHHAAAHRKTKRKPKPTRPPEKRSSTRRARKAKVAKVAPASTKVTPELIARVEVLRTEDSEWF